ncbi:MAG: hypothetical protein Q9217_005713 [Psora testacea]
MAKTPKLKNAMKPSLNSRTSRKRALSPSLGLDKSLANITPPSPPADRTTNILGPQHGAGIYKKRSQKPLRRKQRLRLEQGKEKAMNVLHKTEVKVLESLGRGERRKRRRAKWEDIDEKIEKEVVGCGRKKKQAKEEVRECGDDWVDEEDVPMAPADVGNVTKEQLERPIMDTERVAEAGERGGSR